MPEKKQPRQVRLAEAACGEWQQRDAETQAAVQKFSEAVSARESEMRARASEVVAAGAARAADYVF